MKTDWKNSWCPNFFMSIIILIIVFFLWKCELDFLYYYCKEWNDWVKFILLFIFPFVSLFLVWNLFDWLITKIYGRD